MKTPIEIQDVNKELINLDQKQLDRIKDIRVLVKKEKKIEITKEAAV